jgi:glycosidase
MLTRWYRTGVFYSLDVGLLQDANGDGIGDFQGLIARLDYLARLGISLIWLNPVHLKLGYLRDPGQEPLSFVADSDYGNDVDLDALDVAGYGDRWIRLRRTVGT